MYIGNGPVSHTIMMLLCYCCLLFPGEMVWRFGDPQSVQFASWPVLRNKCHHILYFETSEVLNYHFIFALKLRPGELIEIFIIGSWMDPCGPKIQIFLQPYM